MSGPEQAEVISSHTVALGKVVVCASFRLLPPTPKPRPLGYKPLNPYTLARVDLVESSSSLVKLSAHPTDTAKGISTDIRAANGWKFCSYEVIGGKPISAVRLAVPELIGSDQLAVTTAFLREGKGGSEGMTRAVKFNLTSGVHRTLIIEPAEKPQPYPPLAVMAEEAACALYGLLQIDQDFL